MRNLVIIIFALSMNSPTYCQITITHNNSQTVVADNGITCAQNGSGITRDNGYFGVFDLDNDFGILDNWKIESVEIGIEDARNILNDFYPIYINAYTSDDGTPNGNLTLLGGDTLFISFADELTVVSLDFPDDVIVPGGEVLIIEVKVFGDEQSVFRLGSTDIESNDESWGHAPVCGFPIPITYNDAGFLNVWNIMNVTGDIKVGIQEIASDYLSVFPNPNNGIVNVILPTNYEVLASGLYDLSGKDTGAKIIDGILNTSNLASGIYIMRIRTAEGSLVRKIIKE